MPRRAHREALQMGEGVVIRVELRTRNERSKLSVQDAVLRLPQHLARGGVGAAHGTGDVGLDQRLRGLRLNAAQHLVEFGALIGERLLEQLERRERRRQCAGRLAARIEFGQCAAGALAYGVENHGEARMGLQRMHVAVATIVASTLRA